MSVKSVEVGDYVSFWLWGSRARGRVTVYRYDYDRRDYLIMIMMLSRYYVSCKEWVDLEVPYEVNVTYGRIKSKLRARTAVVYKLKGL